MPRLIKDNAIVEDRWTLVREAAAEADVPRTPAIVPLALWLAARETLKSRVDIAVWLGPADDPDALAADCAALPLIAVDFPQFTTAAVTRSDGSCVRSTASRASCEPSATSCATSSTTFRNAVSTPSPCAATATSRMRSKA